MKKYLTRILCYSIFLIAYTAIIFILVNSFDAVFWISYVFAVVSILLHSCCTVFLTKKIWTQYLTYPVYYVVTSYTAISVVANTVFIFVHSSLTYTVPLVVNIVLLAGYLLYFLLHFRYAIGVQGKEQKTREQLNFVRTASQKLNTIMQSINNIDEQKKIENVYDAVRNSQAIGPNSVRNLEHEIINDIDRLAMLSANQEQQLVDSLCNEIKAKLNRRNIEIINLQAGV